MYKIDYNIPVEIQQLISSKMAYHYKIVPYERNEGLLFFLIEKGSVIHSIKNEIQILLGINIGFYEVDVEVLKYNLYKYYTVIEGTSEVDVNKKDYLFKILSEAKQTRVSDIHVEIFKKTAGIRYRIDGVLVEKYKVELEKYAELINRIKIEANLDITEKRLPQDGRITFDNFDVRVSLLPTLYGEKAVMRLLGKDAGQLSIDDLGFDSDQKAAYLEVLKKSRGIILISGPTGSGKTTTLYSSLKLLNSVKRNIVTIEDPIEYTLEGINQVQLKESIGLDFTAALKSFLRQDPDIIMLGEIRDVDTANMAIRASLTGHLVLSTIHTNSALGTISRLIDMGIPPFYIAETLTASVAQRLIRKLCDNCKEKKSFSHDLFPTNFITPKEVKFHYLAQGCQKCYYTGFLGRRAIYEVLVLDESLINTIKTDYNRLYKKKTNFTKSLNHSAFELFYNGITSLDEVYPFLTD